MATANRYPHMQPFNINGNKTKKDSWWSKPPYHNNGSKRDRKTTESHT